jgi:hypothetical protein
MSGSVSFSMRQNAVATTRTIGLLDLNEQLQSFSGWLISHVVSELLRTSASFSHFLPEDKAV